MTDRYDVALRIRTRSITNVETDRLTGRLAYVGAHRTEMLRDAEQKYDVRVVARECVNIERELTRRGIPFRPVTDGRHLAVDVWEVREVRPPAPGQGRAKT